MSFRSSPALTLVTWIILVKQCNSFSTHHNIRTCPTSKNLDALRAIPSNQEESCAQKSMGRREALISSLLLIAVPTAATAAVVEHNNERQPLETLRIGNAKWERQNDFEYSKMKVNGSLVPPTFATYATRLLINYDQGVSTWWSETKSSYSLLSASDARSKMGGNFGALARSLQIAVESFVTQDADISENSVRQRFEQLFDLFIEKYGNQQGISDSYESRVRNICLLFTTLPATYQPLNKLKESLRNSTVMKNTQNLNLSVAFTEDLTQLLPSKYNSFYDLELKSFSIRPPVAFYEIGVDNEFGQNAVATIFGPLASIPLKRQDPNISAGIYALFGLSGATSCALTHTAVIPVDVVKTRLQTNPEEYSGILDGISSIAKSEGLEGFTLGSQATIAGYFWYGLSVYPSYR